jgi:hypothetical protein
MNARPVSMTYHDTDGLKLDFNKKPKPSLSNSSSSSKKKKARSRNSGHDQIKSEFIPANSHSQTDPSLRGNTSTHSDDSVIILEGGEYGDAENN